MSTKQQIMKRQSGYIKGVRNDLFVVERSPANGTHALTPAVLILQPLFEELNMARRFVSAICGELSSRGYATLVFDLSCSGDSTGDSSDADWKEWVEDVNTICRYLAEKNYLRLHLLSLRGGCLLINHIDPMADFHINGCTLLEPELSGSSVVTRLLRLRAYSSGFGSSRSEKVSELRTRIENGDILEIGGTQIPSVLFQDLASVTCNVSDKTVAGLSQIIDISNSSDDENKKVSGESELPVNVSARCVVPGPLFWSSIEYRIEAHQISSLVDNMEVFNGNIKD